MHFYFAHQIKNVKRIAVALTVAVHIHHIITTKTAILMVLICIVDFHTLKMYYEKAASRHILLQWTGLNFLRNDAFYTATTMHLPSVHGSECEIEDLESRHVLCSVMPVSKRSTFLYHRSFGSDCKLPKIELQTHASIGRTQMISKYHIWQSQIYL